MARNFDGTGDLIQCSQGAIPNAPTAQTWAAIIKRNSTNWNGIITLHTSGGTPVQGIEIGANGDGNQVWLYGGSGAFSRSTFTIVNADNWVYVAADHPGGSAQGRMHKYIYDTNAWTHTTSGDGAITPSTTSISGGSARIGNTSGDVMAGDIAIVGFWTRQLSDAEHELQAFSLAAWLGSAPTALWLLDQSAVAQTVLDLTGGGSNESSRTDTTVSTNSVPVFGYGAPDMTPATAPAGGTDATVTPDVIACTVTVPRPAVDVGAGPATVVVPATLPQPSVDVGAGPAAIATVATVPQPAVDVGAGPAVVAVVAALPRPAVDIGAGPAVVATVAGVPRPAVDVGAGPAAIASVTTLPTPTIDAGGNATVTPDVIATTVTVPRPGVDVAAGPAPVACTVSVPQPAIDVAAGPAVITTAVTMPTPAITVDASVNPAAAALVVAVPRPAVNVGAGPAAIATVVTVPTPAAGVFAVVTGAVTALPSLSGAVAYDVVGIPGAVT